MMGVKVSRLYWNVLKFGALHDESVDGWIYET